MQSTTPKVELGQTVMTRGISNLLALHPSLNSFIQKSIYRHTIGEWGDLCEEDKQANDDAIKYGSHIVCSYPHC